MSALCWSNARQQVIDYWTVHGSFHLDNYEGMILLDSTAQLSAKQIDCHTILLNGFAKTQQISWPIENCICVVNNSFALLFGQLNARTSRGTLNIIDINCPANSMEHACFVEYDPTKRETPYRLRLDERAGTISFNRPIYKPLATHTAFRIDGTSRSCPMIC